MRHVSGIASLAPALQVPAASLVAAVGFLSRVARFFTCQKCRRQCRGTSSEAVGVGLIAARLSLECRVDDFHEPALLHTAWSRPLVPSVPSGRVARTSAPRGAMAIRRKQSLDAAARIERSLGPNSHILGSLWPVRSRASACQRVFFAQGL